MKVIPRVAIDFGSSHIRAITNGSDVPVFSTESIVVREVVSGDVVVLGAEASDYILKPGQELVRPLQDGVMVDYRAAVSLLTYVLSEVLSWWHVFRPQVVVSESLELSSAKSQALGEAVQEAGGGKVYMTAVPALAALGAGIDPSKSVGNFIVDIGCGTTEAAVITRGSAAVSDVKTVGGGRIASAVCQYVDDRYDVTLPRSIAEEIVASVGTALRRDSDSTHDFYVNEDETGEARVLTISGNEVASAIEPVLQEITDLIAGVMKRTPTTLLSDIAQNGLVITGGVGNLDHIDTYVERELTLPVKKIATPEYAVINGGRRALDFISMYEQSIPGN